MVRNEWRIWLAILGLIALFFTEHDLLAAGQAVSLAVTAAIVVVIVMVSTRVAHHAEEIARKVRDPYGSMVLTLSAVLVEVVILGIVMQAEDASPTLVRDTIYSAVMLDINGLIGLAALLGGLRHGEQSYNDDSGRTYAVMILTAMGISMIVPEFIPNDKRMIYSFFTIGVMAVLYALFLRMQVGRHSYFFSYTYPRGERAGAPRAVAQEAASEEHADDGGSFFIAAIIVGGGVVLIGLLAEVMNPFMSAGLKNSGAPVGLVAVTVAAISAAPEILTALRAALGNRMQVVVNIAMGASLSTVILTVPVMEALAIYTGQPFVMAMTVPQTVMVAITIVVAAINFSDGETNAIEGMTHFVLFATFAMLTIMGL
ncbi:MAG TPA: calcium:proton antiporter [Ensifer sp.]|nr:calcium:proton antiporter [Ensifer sp.]